MLQWPIQTYIPLIGQFTLLQTKELWDTLKLFGTAKNRVSFQTGRSLICLQKVCQHYKMYLTLKRALRRIHGRWGIFYGFRQSFGKVNPHLGGKSS